MENITADYKKMAATNYGTALANINTNVGAANSSVNNAYGSYNVVDNKYIIISCPTKNCTVSDGTSNILEVTIADPNNTQTITALFTK
jgi:hypothetical protein